MNRIFRLYSSLTRESRFLASSVRNTSTTSDLTSPRNLRADDSYGLARIPLLDLDRQEGSPSFTGAGTSALKCAQFEAFRSGFGTGRQSWALNSGQVAKKR